MQSVFHEGNASGHFVPPAWFFFRSENYGWFCSVLKQSSHRALQNLAFDFLLQMTNTLNHPLIHPILHFFDPMHSFRRKLWTSTYLSLESYLPTSTCCRRGEFVEMKIWNLQSLLVCPIILWRVSSTEDDWIFGWLSRQASLILNWCLILILPPCEEWIGSALPELHGFNSCGKGAEEGNWISKNVSRYTMRPKCLAARLCGSAFPENGLAFLQGMTWERCRVNGNVRLSTAYWFSILKIFWIIQKNWIRSVIPVPCQ